jgi:Rps23 Pro-64 3,4-dihydroxylase Tpa1-like proline 4-hydroxylase
LTEPIRRREGGDEQVRRAGAWGVAEKAAAWRSAEPFVHVVLDDFVRGERLAELGRAFEDEPASEIHDEIFAMMASNKRLEHPTFRAFEDELGGRDVLEAVSAIAAHPVARVELRAYAYQPGHYLLPHADHQPEVGRAVAIAFYVDARDVEGGELELFACSMRGAEIVATRAARRIEARPNRAVLFEVSDRSLHQVREVTRGARLSLAGWFYP